MARRRRSRNIPTETGDYPQPTSAGGDFKPEQFGGPLVTLFSNTHGLSVTARMRGPASVPLPQPRIAIVDRPDRVGLTQWLGRNPYEMTIPLLFDGLAGGRVVNGRPRGESVEGDVMRLARLAIRRQDQEEPPVIQMAGPVPQPEGASGRWRINALTEVPDRTLILDRNGRLLRAAVDVGLIEEVEDRLFESSRREGKSAAGLSGRRDIRKGENLHQFAKRVLGKRSKADEVARANSLSIGYVAKSSHPLRLP